MDVSRGCVLVKNTDIGVYKKLTVSLLWMDDEELAIGKDYLVKVGTKTIPGILTHVQYAIDVNTGEHVTKDSLHKNEIAVCELLLRRRHCWRFVCKATRHPGELILIDRVTNMTSACGVVETVAEKVTNGTEKASFRLNDLTARGDIFEEFYYDTSSLNVLKYQPVNRTYTIGGLKSQLAEKATSIRIALILSFCGIRLLYGYGIKKITAILPAADYVYDHVPVINGRGFAVLADSNEQVQQFLQEYAATNEAEPDSVLCKMGAGLILTERLFSHNKEANQPWNRNKNCHANPHGNFCKKQRSGEENGKANLWHRIWLSDTGSTHWK